jgi:large subunit ribosomal protein L35
MPKMKTHKGVKKRFRLTANGKVKARQAGTSHLATRKTHKTRRMRRGTAVLEPTEWPKLTAALGKHSY